MTIERNACSIQQFAKTANCGNDRVTRKFSGRALRLGRSCAMQVHCAGEKMWDMFESVPLHGMLIFFGLVH
jgi:hypothetical protein